MTRGFRIRADLTTLAVLSQLFVLALTAATAFQPALAWTGSASTYEYLSFVLFYIVVMSVVRSPYDLGFLLTVWVTVQVAYWSKAEWEFWVHGAGRESMDVLRMTGIDETGGHPNSLATMVVANLPFVAVFLLSLPVLTPGWPTRYARLARPAAWAAGLIGIATAVLTNSRAGMVALLAMVGVYILRKHSFAKIIKIGAVCLVVAVIVWSLLPESSRDRYLSIIDSSASNASAQESAEGRVAGVRIGMEIWRRFPIFGVGPNNFRYYRQVCMDGSYLDSHNLAAQIVSQSGTLGALSFLFLLGVLLHNSSRLVRWGYRVEDPGAKYYGRLGRAIRLSLLGLLVTGLANHNYFRIEWVWLAAVSNLGLRFLAQRLEQLDSQTPWEFALHDAGPINSAAEY